MFLNNIYKYDDIFDIYLFTLNIIQEDDYTIPSNIKRIFIKDKKISNLIIEIKKKKIEILIYQFPHSLDINSLNKLKRIRTIFYIHSSLFYWIHYNLKYIQLIYKEYINSKYIVSLIPLENYFLFINWGIRSILMNNYITYEYKSIKPSDLFSKTILMIGRADDKYKRFALGILSFEYIKKEIPETEMKIISDLNTTYSLQDLAFNLKLKDNIQFVGFTLKPEIYFKNASLHLFPTLTEAFPMVLAETKIFGIPNILLGLDYVSLSKGGTVIIYDESIETMAKESIKILKNDQYRKKLGNEARLSMKKFNNELLLKRWVKLILAVFIGDDEYEKLRNSDKILDRGNALHLLRNQINLIKRRKPNFINITINDILNFTIIQNYTIYK